MIDQYRQAFQEEAYELLGTLEAALLELVQNPTDSEIVGRAFRALHTIKGSGAMFGFDDIAGFAHHLESAFDQLRNGHLAATGDLINLALAAGDQIKAMLDASTGRGSVEQARTAAILAELNQLIASAGRPPDASAAPPPAPDGADAGPARDWRIAFRPGPNMLLNGTNPLLLLCELRELGPLRIDLDTAAVPPLDELDPARCYLGWNLVLTTAVVPEAIRDIFIFVEGDCKLTVEPAPERAAEFHSPALTEAPKNDPAGPSPAAPGSASTSPVAVAKTEQSGSQAGETLTGQARLEAESELELSPPNVPEPLRPCGPAQDVPGSALKEPASEAPKPAEDGLRKARLGESTVRVPAGRLDHLVNLVGELVMNQSRIAQAASQAGVADLANPVQELERLVAELRDDVLGIRMLPIGTIFGRFSRLIHDLSLELGKEVDLITEGAETELDKSILDQLADPLVHVLRNSIDHGIEPAEQRVSQGKPRRATIRLTALHAGSDVVIRISDDGRGIDRAAVRAKAVERQLISADAALSDKEILNLLVLPGFSTARQVTSVSGRGVGLDVVKKQIDALRGSLSITSEAGQGCRVSLTLPLTLAIIDGLLVQLGRDQFIIPLAAIMENVELYREQRQRNNGRNVIAVRGELVPYIDLRQAFHVEGAAPAIEKIVIVQHEEQRVGLVVDRVLGTHQTVLQSLGRFFRSIDVVSGATILGNGNAALILDVAAIVRFVDRAGQANCDRGAKS